MLPDCVSNPGPLTYESGALPIALHGLAQTNIWYCIMHCIYFIVNGYPSLGRNSYNFLSPFSMEVNSKGKELAPPLGANSFFSELTLEELSLYFKS